MDEIALVGVDVVSGGDRGDDRQAEARALADPVAGAVTERFHQVREPVGDT